MRLAALTTTKIEGDIIEAFVRYTLRFVDHLIVVDNGSLDGTPALLSALAAEGLPLTIWEGEQVTASTQRRTELVREAFAALDTDYLLLIDTDEFLYARSRTALESALRGLPNGAHALVPILTYVPTRADDPGEQNPIARIRHRLATERVPVSKLFINKSFRAASQASVIPGNHAIADPAGSSTSVPLPGIALAHFPVRSPSQLQSKAILGWPRFLAMGFDERRGIAYHWRRLNEQLQAQPDWDTETYLHIAAHYYDEDDDDGVNTGVVLDPLPAPHCRYVQKPPNPLAVAIAFTNQMARAYALASGENARLKDALDLHAESPRVPPASLQSARAKPDR